MDKLQEFKVKWIQDKMDLKWCRQCTHLQTQWDAYSRWFAICTHGYDEPIFAAQHFIAERRIASFYFNSSFKGNALEHLLKYDDISNYSEKEKLLKPDLNIRHESQFKIPDGCPYILEYIMLDNQTKE